MAKINAILTTCKLTLVTAKMLEYKTTQRYSICTPRVIIIKEQDGTQFLQIGVTMAKLWPLLYYCKFL